MPSSKSIDKSFLEIYLFRLFCFCLVEGNVWRRREGFHLLSDDLHNA